MRVKIVNREQHFLKLFHVFTEEWWLWGESEIGKMREGNNKRTE